MLATKFSQFFCYKPYDFFNKTKTVCGLQKWRKNSNGNRMWKEKTYTFAYNKFNTFQYFWRVLPLFQYSISQQLREVRLRLHDEPKDPDLGDEKKSVRPRELYWATYLENWGVSTITGAAMASQRNNILSERLLKMAIQPEKRKKKTLATMFPVREGYVLYKPRSAYASSGIYLCTCASSWPDTTALRAPGRPRRREKAWQ